MRAILYLSLLGAAPPVVPTEPTAHELVVLHPHRPYRVRLHASLHGQPAEASWNRLVEELFRFLDVDGDGLLSRAEVGRAPSREQWQQLSAGTPTIEPDAAPDFTALARGKAKATLADLKSWYRASTAGPFQVSWGWRARGGDPVSDALWRHLDRDRDGRLSRGELDTATRWLDQLDLDEDDLLSQNEIVGINQGFFYEPPPTFTRGLAHGPAQGGLPFFSRRLDEPTGPLVQALLARYGRAGARTLQAAELKLSKEVFTRLDRNKDSHLDAAELAAWAQLPADVEVRVPLEASDRTEVTLLTVTDREVQARREPGRVRLVLGGWWIDLTGALLPSVSPRRTATTPQPDFQRLDTDRNGYLDSRELYQPPFSHVAWLRLADRDGNGKITAEEFTAFSSLRGKMQAGVTFLRVEDRGRSLFRLLDGNGDGRLGIRERRDVVKRLSGLIRDPRGLDRAGLPLEYRVTLAHGRVPPDFDGPPPLTPRPTPLVSRGPLWFRKMDRNGDGDVSRAEWLGEPGQFGKIDRDGDGLISPEEAWQADALFRKKASHERRTP